MFSLIDYVDMVTKNHKSNKWLNCTEQVLINGTIYGVGIKAFGLWVQRIEINGRVSDLSECKTQKAFKANLTSQILSMVK